MNYLACCEEAARAGGARLLEWRGRFQAREKGPADLVTEADLASQDAVRDVILRQFPDHQILAEEGLHDARLEAGACWVIDPLDGTTNYVHGFPCYAVSVALVAEGKIECGCVYDPLAEACYTAQAGNGAHLNGDPLQVSGVRQLSEALMAASFAAYVDPEGPEIGNFTRVLLASQAVRRLGSAALNLCHVAAGQFDGFWATDTKLWDVAAGFLIVQEAGGVVTPFDGETPVIQRPHFISAATPELERELRGVLDPPSAAE